LFWLAETFCVDGLVMTINAQAEAKATTTNLRMASFIFRSDVFSQSTNEINNWEDQWHAVIDETLR
jgi:hypothetical protein